MEVDGYIERYRERQKDTQTDGQIDIDTEILHKSVIHNMYIEEK